MGVRQVKTGSKTIQPVAVTEEQDNWQLGMLNPKQRQFVDELLSDRDFNATNAAKKAGYHGPNQAGRRLLAMPAVLQHIGNAIHERGKRNDVTKDRVLQEIARLAYVDPKQVYGPDGQVLNIPDMPEDARRAVSRFEVTYEENGEDSVFKRIKVWFWNKEEALRQLAMHVGILKEAILHVNQVTVNWLDLYSLIGRLAGKKSKCPKCGHEFCEQEPAPADVIEHDPVEQQIQDARSGK
jgi:phage terminase small subunit